jgi:hypothetical protein
MTIPYLPGIGDTLAQLGPQLGQNLSKILQPNKEREQMLQKLLINNPDAINQFVELERTNPGITANMFGPKGQQFIAGSDFTPSFKRQQESEDLKLAGQKQGLEVGAQGLAQGAINLERSGIDLKDAQRFEAFKTALPTTTQRRIFFKDALGMQEEEINELEARSESRNLARTFMEGKDFNTILGAVKNKTVDLKALAGLYEVNPALMNQIFGQLDFEREAGLRRELAALASRDRRRDMMDQLFLDTARQMSSFREKGFNLNTGAVFQHIYGVDPSAAPSYTGSKPTELELNAVQGAFNTIRASSFAKEIAPLQRAIHELGNKNLRGTGKQLAAGTVNQQLELLGSDYRIVQDQGFMAANKFKFADTKGNIVNDVDLTKVLQADLGYRNINTTGVDVNRATPEQLSTWRSQLNAVPIERREAALENIRGTINPLDFELLSTNQQVDSLQTAQGIIVPPPVSSSPSPSSVGGSDLSIRRGAGGVIDTTGGPARIPVDTTVPTPVQPQTQPSPLPNANVLNFPRPELTQSPISTTPTPTPTPSPTFSAKELGLYSEWRKKASKVDFIRKYGLDVNDRMFELHKVLRDSKETGKKVEKREVEKREVEIPGVLERRPTRRDTLPTSGFTRGGG